MSYGKYVLIIEDDQNLGDLIEGALELENWICVRSNKISEAILKLRNQEFNCILLDMNLAGGGRGEELLDQIRDDEVLQNITTPVIIVSGTLDHNRVGGVYKKVSDILMKPFTVNALIEKVNKVCQKK